MSPFHRLALKTEQEAEAGSESEQSLLNAAVAARYMRAGVAGAREAVF